MTITEDPTGFSKSFIAHFNDNDKTEFFFHKLTLADQQIINVQMDGVMDTTFDIPMTTQASINYASSMEIDGNTLGVPEPVLMIGDHANMKISIVASQIAKLIALRSPRHTCLSIGSRWFGTGDEVQDGDFEKLMFIIENIKKLL
ncbi:uncharacterized protein SPAPADRAFT_55948 [Spathaspora passalidarum NRRL Y-27907]|uniref:Proteasome assembly chaperone 3 n=1 Tax=Spathaspora passalidarum (strain NRRL Y-27907 / 11-Y1) TaxID=619300 RepID=G3AND3_SPAPN|nr:uncharacterized protein SPAPADRAFT_55948 [Spathaspora passalidarum NRRL Y-27907]EGW32516.1 hypothetical protein SPAPADRAFT_55948 [Spathaspora passalidarum NRRL Y-27907]